MAKTNAKPLEKSWQSWLGIYKNMNLRQHHDFLTNVLEWFAIFPLFYLFVVDMGYYKYHLTIPWSALLPTYMISVTFLYMAHEHFRTERLLDKLDALHKTDHEICD